MTKKNTSLLTEHKITPGEQVPLHVTNKLLRDIPAKPKSEMQKAYDDLPLDEKIKTAKGKRKPKRII